jgi:dTDP-4-dehydrorhamnose reductase
MWLPGAMILRTSWIYSVHGHNFFKTMIRLSATHPELRVVFDQTGTPTYAPDLATAIMTIILRVESGEVSEEQIAGIWNFSNEGVCSWYDFAVAIMKKTGAGSVVVPVRTHEFPTPARRPAYSVLDKCKIKTTFGIDIPHWESGLERCVSAWLLGGG